jgi:autotransporter-associated beta strand protein
MRGPGGLTSSANFVQLSGTNTYNGPTTVHAPGTLRMVSNGALGDPTNVVTVDAGASLQFGLNGVVIPNPINLAGSIDALVFNGTNTLAGRLTLNGPGPALHSSSGALNVSAPIGGNSDLLIGFTNFAFGTVVLDADTSHTGVTRLLGGNLFVNGISSASAFIASSNSTLGGSGQLESLEAAGAVAPGRSGVPAILRVIGTAALER